MSSEVDVVVAGGGPVGLTLACELALAGVKVQVLERRLEPTAQSRALTIHGRTLEMLQLRGIADRFLSRGIQVPTGHYAVLDTRLDFSVFDTRFPFTLFLPQATTEQLLEARALELGVSIRRGAEVEDSRQDATGVTVTGMASGEPFSVRARYLAGADGARSTVRQQAGIDFVGVDADHTLILGDVILDAPPEGKTFTAVTGDGLIMVAPLGDGKRHRIVLFDRALAKADKTAPLELQELASSALKIAARDFRPRDPIWLSRFTDETRLASHYRNGRVFVIGDAAHIHMPAGGQGMNVGMQDAMNLGWKLAAVAKGFAGDDLLDSYHRERHPVGLALYDNTLAQTALIVGLDERGLALRQAMSELLKRPSANRVLADQVSGFGVTYDSTLSAAPAGASLAAQWIGKRVSDWPLRLADGSATSAYQLLKGGKWLWLDLDESGQGRDAPALDARMLDRVRADPATAEPALEGVSALLIRPDGYAGYGLRKA